jgi:hypothetical protein
VRHPWYGLGLAAALLAVGMHLGDTIRFRMQHLTPRADWPLARVEIEDWRAICKWALEETPDDAVFLVPRLSHTFRWYSNRAEVVTRKDLPQDARSIVEWWERLADIYDAGTPSPLDSLAPVGAERLRILGERYGAGYVVSRPDETLALPRVGPITRTVAIYQLPPAAGGTIIPETLVPEGPARSAITR